MTLAHRKNYVKIFFYPVSLLKAAACENFFKYMLNPMLKCEQVVNENPQI